MEYLGIDEETMHELPTSSVSSSTENEAKKYEPSTCMKGQGKTENWTKFVVGNSSDDFVFKRPYDVDRPGVRSVIRKGHHAKRPSDAHESSNGRKKRRSGTFVGDARGQKDTPDSTTTPVHPNVLDMRFFQNPTTSSTQL